MVKYKTEEKNTTREKKFFSTKREKGEKTVNKCIKKLNFKF